MLTFYISFIPVPLPTSVPKGFKINNTLKANWITSFHRRPQYLPPSSIPNIDRTAQSLLKDINAVISELFNRYSAPDP